MDTMTDTLSLEEQFRVADKMVAELKEGKKRMLEEKEAALKNATEGNADEPKASSVHRVG